MKGLSKLAKNEPTQSSRNLCGRSSFPLQFGKIFLVSDLKWHSDMRYMNKFMHLNSPVHVVSSMLNSATGTPLAANIGANPAAGYTTDDVPT